VRGRGKEPTLGANRVFRENAPKKAYQTVCAPYKCVQTELDEPRHTRGVHPDYKYLNDPFPDEEEASIASISRPEAFTVVSEDECCSLTEAKVSPE